MGGRAALVALALLSISTLTNDPRALSARRSKAVSNHEDGPAISSPGALVVRDAPSAPRRQGFEAIEPILVFAVARLPLPIGAADNLPQDIARSMLACWRAPHEGDEVTLRMSFRRDGSVFGKPRMTYMRAAGGPDGEAELANSVYAAISACTPLRFTPSLGAAIAGRIFLIRFVAMRKEQRAAL